MDPEQLRQTIRAQPFLPFTIRMDNDRIYHVDHPENAVMAANGWAVTVVDNNIFRILALNSMASIEVSHPGADESGVDDLLGRSEG